MGRVSSRHAEDFFGDRLGVRRVLGDLHASALASSAGVDLRLDDDATAQFFRHRLGFFWSVRYLAARNGDTVTGKERLGLILVDLHDLL